jgi:hypothetical protein
MSQLSSERSSTKGQHDGEETPRAELLAVRLGEEQGFRKQ